MAATSAAGAYYQALTKYENAEHAWDVKMHDTCKDLLSSARNLAERVFTNFSGDPYYGAEAGKVYRAARYALENYDKLTHFPKTEEHR